MGDRVDRQRKETGRENEWLNENVEQLQESLDEEKRTRQDMKERKNREVIEKEMETENELNATRESEKEMERKDEAAMEQMKILDWVFGKDCNEMKQLVEDSIRMIKEKVRQQDSEECDRIFKGTRVYLLGESTSEKETTKGIKHTLPVLLICNCSGEKKCWRKL